jgi:hypothetical protein
MQRKRSPVAIAAGKLILTLQKERAEQKVVDRAHTLLQAAHRASVSSLLDGRSVADYLDPVWVKMHPAVEPSIVALIAAMNAHENI